MVLDQLDSQTVEQVLEYERCKNDLMYFIEHVALITAPGGDVHIQLYDLQRRYLQHLLDEKYSIILKSRQVGASTMSQLQCAWEVTFYDGVVIGIVSKSGDESTAFARAVMDILDKLPPHLKPKFKKRTEQTFILENGSKLYSAAVNPSAPTKLLRGKSITHLIIDEAAFIFGIEEGLAGCGPSVVKAQKTAKLNNIPYGTTIISTPNKTTGIGKWYFDMWKKAERGEGAYKPFVMHWKDIAEFADDPEWYPTQCALLGNVKWRIAQELDLEFVASSNSFFDADIIKQLNKIDTKPISIMTINGHDLKLYEKPSPDKFYLIGIDTASAYGEDKSVLWIMDYETGNQVAEFHSKLRVDDFCPIVEEVCKIFPNNILIPECNSYGNQVCEYLTRKGTFNLYQTKTKSKEVSNNKVKYRYGLYTSPINRPLMIDALYTMVTENIEGIKSRSTALELISLVDDGNGKVLADEGEHDDLCLAFSFCCYIRLYDPPKTLLSKTTSKEEKEYIEDVMQWNQDQQMGTPGVNNMLQQVMVAADETNDPIKKQQLMNQAYRKFINTNLDKLLQQAADQDPNSNQGSYINLMDIMQGKRNTSWF